MVEPYCETKFVESSFGFRKQVSTHNALAKVKSQCQTMPYVLSVDMKDFFGTIDPDIAYRELWHIGIKDQIILNYIYRFIKKGYYEDSCKVENPKGSPQGSILGPLISNVYLHRFDVWLRDQGDCWHDRSVAKFHNYANKRRNLALTNLKVGIHVRYADDILVLCKDYEDAVKFKYSVTNYLTRNMKLEINEDKTKIYDLTREKMKYLGYDFYAYKKQTKNPQQKGKLMVTNELPKSKEDVIVKKCRELLHDIRRNPSFETIHAWNAYVVGVHNYYKGMSLFCLSFGFKMKVHRKGNKLVVISYIADKNFDHKRQKLKTQAKRIVHPRKIYGEQGEIRLYNSMVTGMQNYYCIATHINHDCAILNRAVMTLLTNRLSTRNGNRLVKTGRELTEFERSRFGKSKMMRYVAGTNEPVYPIGYTQHKNPLFRKKTWNYYTPEGREGIHNNLRINMAILLSLMRKPPYGYSAEYADNRISLFSAQWGKCAVTGEEFSSTHEIHCHHKLPRYLGGDDSYGNLILVKDSVHKLIHAINADTIAKYLELLQLDKSQLKKVNTLRELASLPLI